MESVSWDLAIAMVQFGWTVVFVTTRCPGKPKEFIADGVQVLTVNSVPGKYSVKWWFGTRKLVKSDDRLRQAHVLFSVSAGAFAIVSRSDAIIKVAQIHGTSLAEVTSKLKQRSLLSFLKAIKNIGWMLRDFTYQKFDALIAIGEKVENDLKHPITRKIIGETQVVTISNGLNEKEFEFSLSERLGLRAEHKIADAQRLIISVSRLHEQKGVRQSLDAIKFLVNQGCLNYKFFIIGDGPEKQKLEHYAKQVGIIEYVTFLGSVNRLEIKKWLSAADVFLFTTLRQEGLPTNVLEAHAAGLPVVISEHAMDRRFQAVAVDPQQPSTIAAAIKTVSIVGERISTLHEDFNIKNSAKYYCELFGNIAGEKN